MVLSDAGSTARVAMTRLHELAAEFGVETRRYATKFHGDLDCDTPPPTTRSDLDIAHDLLAKLPNTVAWTINHIGGYQWSWFWRLGDDGIENGFPAAVCALAELALKEAT